MERELRQTLMGSEVCRRYRRLVGQFACVSAKLGLSVSAAVCCAPFDPY